MKIDVSIVIVCMNNLKNLYPCLNSIKQYTSCSYEVLVTAYLFDKANLAQAKLDFPWVVFIESNEIRGFAENNNLALKRAKGKYCFVLNDDTVFPMPVADMLLQDFEKIQDADVIVPFTYFPDDTIQCAGRPKHTALTHILFLLRLWNERNVKSKYVNQKGIFQTYNVLGAAFMIKTDFFRDLGWFDEKYFFTPEDIALSTLVNERGGKVYADSNIKLYHYEGGTSSVSYVKVATLPAGTRGTLIFFSRGNRLKYFLLSVPEFMYSLAKYGQMFVKYHFKRKLSYKVEMIGFLNCLRSIYTTLSTKEIFIKYYSKINEYKKHS